MTTKKLIVAIDPDVDRSGVCFLYPETKKVRTENLTFPQMVDLLRNFEYNYVENVCEKSEYIILVEAGWLCQSNWHLGYKDGKQLAAAKGVAVGRNHETGRKIVEMIEHYKLNYQLVKPLKKIWKGESGKITQKEISKFVPEIIRSNQETRDAVLIAWINAGFGVII